MHILSFRKFQSTLSNRLMITKANFIDDMEYSWSKLFEKSLIVLKVSLAAYGTDLPMDEAILTIRIGKIIAKARP